MTKTLHDQDISRYCGNQNKKIAAFLPGLKSEGSRSEVLKPGSYLALGEIADYYLQGIEEDEPEETAIMLEIDLGDLAGLSFGPDNPGLSEPIATIIGRTEDDIWNAWVRSGGSWSDCFRIIGSVQSTSGIPAHLIKVA